MAMLGNLLRGMRDAVSGYVGAVAVLALALLLAGCASGAAPARERPDLRAFQQGDRLAGLEGTSGSVMARRAYELINARRWDEAEATAWKLGKHEWSDVVKDVLWACRRGQVTDFRRHEAPVWQPLHAYTTSVRLGELWYGRILYEEAVGSNEADEDAEERLRAEAEAEREKHLTALAAEVLKKAGSPAEAEMAQRALDLLGQRAHEKAKAVAREMRERFPGSIAWRDLLVGIYRDRHREDIREILIEKRRQELRMREAAKADEPQPDESESIEREPVRQEVLSNIAWARVYLATSGDRYGEAEKLAREFIRRHPGSSRAW